MAKEKNETTEQNTEEKKPRTIANTQNQKAWVGLTLDELTEIKGANFDKETVTNGDVNKYVRELLGLPVRVRQTSSQRKERAKKLGLEETATPAAIMKAQEELIAKLEAKLKK